MSNDMLQTIANELSEIGVPNSVIDAANVLNEYFSDKNSYVKQQLFNMTMSNALLSIININQPVSQVISSSRISTACPKNVQLSANSVSSETINAVRPLPCHTTQIAIKPLFVKKIEPSPPEREMSETSEVKVVSPISPFAVKIVRPRTIVTTPLSVERTTVAIIGSAGKNVKIAGNNYSLNKANPSIFDDMVSRATALINENVAAENIELISGGAAWSDHVAVQIYINHKQGGQSSSSVVDNKNYILTLYLPETFTDYKYFDSGDQHWSSNPGRVSNNYHRRFSESLGDVSGNISRQQIALAIKLGARVYTRKGFHERNSDIARAQYLYAFTWEQGEPTVGGTADTWNKARKNGSICKSINLYELAHPGKPYPQITLPSYALSIKPLQLNVLPSVAPATTPPTTTLPLMSKIKIKPLTSFLTTPSPPQSLTLEIVPPTRVQFVDVDYEQPDVLEESEPEIYSDKARMIIHTAIGDAISADDDATMTAQLKIILHRYDGNLDAFLQDVESSGAYNYVIRYDDVPTNFVDLEELEELVELIYTYQNEC